MSIAQNLGRFLFIFFLVFRGVQHLQRPEEWITKFNQKYTEYFDLAAKLPFIIEKLPLIQENVPGHILELFQPEYFSVYVKHYGRYLGYAEFFAGICILLQVPLLPLFGATLLLVELVLFFNLEELHSSIVNFAVVGIMYMMAFAPPARYRGMKKAVKKNICDECAARGKSGDPGKTRTEDTGDQEKKVKKD